MYVQQDHKGRKKGDTITFTGNIGLKRTGTILAIWEHKGIYYAHVKCEPRYVYENDAPILIVCLSSHFINHPYCQVED